MTPDPELARTEECLEWVQRAEWDVRSARVLLIAQSPVPETACFHAQQAVEKILKAFLVARGVLPARTHNLGLLLKDSADFEPSLISLREACHLLTPYAVDLRYPGDMGVVDKMEAGTALNAMKKVVSAVSIHLPAKAQALIRAALI